MLIQYLTFATLAAPGAFLPAGEPQNLSYKWAVNQTISYRIATDNTLKMSGLPMGDVSQTVHQVCTLSLTPKEVADDGSATLEAVYQAISLEMQPFLDQTKHAFDSANPGADDAGNDLVGSVGAVVGQPFTVVLGADGSLHRIDGFAPIADKAIQAAPPGSKVTPLLKSTFSEQSVSKLFEIAFHRLPGTPVETGSTWPTTYDTNLPQIGTLSAQGQSSLVSLDAGVATIDTTIAITLKPPGAGEPVNPMMRNMKIENAGGTANSIFDVERGVLRRFVGKVSVPFKSPAPAGGDKPAANVSVLIDTSTTVELAEGQ